MFTLSPSFAENAAALAAYAKAYSRDTDLRDDWRERIEEFTYQYFTEAKGVLVNLQFDQDDMLREGFKEGVDKNELSLRVVKDLKNMSGYNEALIEQRVLVMQMKPSTWAMNVGDVLVDVINLL